MKPVLLLYPPFEGKNYLKSRSPFPIGPLYIAAYLKKKGIQSFVKDFSYPPEKHKTKRPEQLKTGQPNYFRFGYTNLAIEKWLKKNLKKYHNTIGVSSLMSSNWSGAYKLIDIIKKVSLESAVVIGGPHATAFPDHVAKHSQSDYICIGEGEDVFYQFLKNRQHEAIIRSGESMPHRTNFFESLDNLPFPKRELLMDNRKTKDMYVTFSRGCPHKCSFCGSYLIQGRRWRHKSVSRVTEEIDFYYKEWEVRHFIIEDDNPCVGSKGINHLKKICKRIVAEIPKIKLSVSHGIPVYATADKELCKLMWKAGFRRMSFPLESTDERVLKDMNKENTPKNWMKGIRNWKWEDHSPTQIILGYPFRETIETMLKTMIDIAEEKCLVWASHFRLNKGTPLFKRCLDMGYINKDYDPINTQSFFLETERFTIKDLRELMQISRAINFAVEYDCNPFKEVMENKYFNSFKIPKKEGDVVAKGMFKFKKNQNITSSIMLTATGKFSGRPFCSYRDPDTIIYKGEKESRVYNSLKFLLTGKKIRKISDYL